MHFEEWWNADPVADGSDARTKAVAGVAFYSGYKVGLRVGCDMARKVLSEDADADEHIEATHG
jgi:hypothetical protein